MVKKTRIKDVWSLFPSSELTSCTVEQRNVQQIRWENCSILYACTITGRNGESLKNRQQHDFIVQNPYKCIFIVPFKRLSGYKFKQWIELQQACKLFSPTSN